MMDLKKGDKGTITFGDNTTAKVEVTNVQTYPNLGAPADVFFKYQEGETNKQIVHPDLEDTFPLPEFLVNQVFAKDV